MEQKIVEQKTNKFVSRVGFILACVGSAVGMANVWGFPYKLGSNGGGAFLLIYILFVILFGYVGLSAEYAIGRRSGTGTLGSYTFAWQHGGKDRSRIGSIIGWLPLIGSITIAVGYAVIIAYVLKAFTQSLFGSIMTVNPGQWFESFAFKPFSVVPYHAAVIIITLLTIVLGVDTIEKSNKVMMPLFFILFVILAIRISFLPGAGAGYRFLFIADWTYLKNPSVWITAMGQAFFSLSITGSGMIVYGAYLSKDHDCVDGAKNTALFDTIAAVVAALVMIPACFAYRMDPAGGPGLLFVVLPSILQQMPGGRLFGIILYLVVVFGGISSLQNMLEVVAESLLHRFRTLKRTAVITALGGITFGIGVFMEPIAETKGAILGGWGTWMDVVSTYIIPIGAVLGAVSWFWVLKKEELLDEINTGAAKRYGNGWYYLGKYVYTLFALLLCIIALVRGEGF
jgi:transporter